MKERTFGHAKIILFGEHAVVYGHPAVAAALDRGVWASAKRIGEEHRFARCQPFDLNIQPFDGSDWGNALGTLVDAIPGLPDGFELDVEFDIAPGIGLGSSAAFCVSVTRALLQLSSVEADHASVLEIANRGEAVFHHKPSGIDTTVAFLGGTMQYQTDSAPRPLSLNKPLTFIVVEVEASPPTYEMVERVAQLRNTHPKRVDSILARIDYVTHEGASALRSEDEAQVGFYLNENHRALQELNVCTDQIDELQRIALEQGAIGAKLTGAGGGGCLVVFAPALETDLSESLQRAGAKHTFIVTID